jgi:DNA-binding GntR family transcriptional regulator
MRKPYLTIADDLRGKIDRGELLPGEQLNLDRLATEYGVSRPTVRRAVQVLEADGLIKVEPRWGTFVAER